jgi:hypothetical protein
MESLDMKRKGKEREGDEMEVQISPPHDSSTSGSPPAKKYKSEGRIIVVSYRLPIEIILEEGERAKREQDGMEIAEEEAETSSIHLNPHGGPVPRRARGRNAKGTVGKRSRSPNNFQDLPAALEDYPGLAYNAHNLRFDRTGDVGAHQDGYRSHPNLPVPASEKEGEDRERDLKELNGGKKRWRLERQTKLIMKVLCIARYIHVIITFYYLFSVLVFFGILLI